MNESYVVIYSVKCRKCGVKKLLGGFCGYEVVLIFCVIVKNTVKRAPESVSPIMQSNNLPINMNSVFINSVGKLIS